MRTVAVRVLLVVGVSRKIKSKPGRFGVEFDIRVDGRTSCQKVASICIRARIDDRQPLGFA
jgi:hypothetical protein